MSDFWKFVVAMTAVTLMVSNIVNVNRIKQLQAEVKNLAYISDLHTKTLKLIVAK